MKPVDLTKALSMPLRTVISGAPEGLDALILSELARAALHETVPPPVLEPEGPTTQILRSARS